MREVTLAATQMTCSKNNTENIDKAESCLLYTSDAADE